MRVSKVSQRTFEEFFLKFSLCDLYLNGFIHLLCMTTSVIRIILDGCGKKRINEGGLSQARFARDLERFLST